MKQKITFFKVLLTLLLLCGVGNAWGEEACVELCTSWSKTLAYATGYTQDYTIDDLNGGTTTMTLAVQGVYRQAAANTYFQMNKKTGYFKNTTKMPGKITKIVTTWSVDKSATKCYFAESAEAMSSDKTVTVTAATSVTYTAPADADYYYFNIDVSSGSGSAQMTSCIVYYEKAVASSVATPNITPNGGSFVNNATATMTCATEGATIYYTTDGTEPTNTSSAYTEPVTVTETTTFKAIAYKDGEYSKVATATYTKIFPLTTMDAIYAESETDGKDWVTFNNWIVSSVNGSNAYLTDNDGKGLIIYNSNHGFNVNDVLSGTVNCDLTRYNGSAEITNLTSESKNLTVTHNGTLNTKETTIGSLSGVNTGAYIDLGTLTYDGTSFTDGTNTIKPYDALDVKPTLKSGVKYKVKGMYLQYMTTREIVPQTVSDFEEVPATEYVIAIESLENGSVTSDIAKAQEGQTVTLTITPNAHYALNEGTLYVLNETTADEIEVVDNKFTMPASNVLVSAEFVELPKHTVIYSVLGKDAGDEEVYDGETIANAPTPDGFDEWEFAGWTTDENYAMSTTAPNLITETTPVDNDYMLYAVFKFTVAGSVSYEKVTSALTDWRGDYLIANSSSVFMDGSLAGGKDGVGKAQSHVNPGNALNGTSITADWGNEHYVTLEAIDDADLSKGYVIKSHSTQTPYFYQTSNTNGMSSTANKSTAANYPISIVFNSENDIDIALGGAATGAILHYNNASGSTGEMFRFYKDGGQQNIYLYKKNGLSVTHYTINEPKTQNVNISDAGYATAYIPFNATISNEANDVKAYYVTVLGNNAQLNEIKGTIRAETGVVLKGAKGTVTFTESAGTLADVEGNLLVGTAVEGGDVFCKDNTTYYILSSVDGKVGFYWDPNSNDGDAAICAQYKAVLAVSNTSAAAPSFFTFDDATAINGISNVKASGVRYNLNGQAVGEDYKGIVIVNGKKMFNK